MRKTILLSAFFALFCCKKVRVELLKTMDLKDLHTLGKEVQTALFLRHQRAKECHYKLS